MVEIENHTGHKAEDDIAPEECDSLKDDRNTDLDNCQVIEDFDDILDIIGSQGKFQKFLLYAVVCPITAIQPFLTLNAIFMLYTPEHWCYVPGRDNDTSLEAWKILTLPVDRTRMSDSNGRPKYSQCTMYTENGVEKCNETWGWEFDQTDYKTTLPSAFNWVCENAAVSTNSFTAAAIGNACGTIVFGHFADKNGRKPIFFLTMAINIVFRIISLFYPENIEFFYVCQFIIGTAFPVMFIAPSMIAAEVCDKVYRAHVYAVTWQIWVMGMAALPLVAWLCSDWYLIGLATTLPGISVFIYHWYLPESPRWLLSVGKHEEAAKLLYQIAKVNGRAERTTETQLNSMLRKLIAKQNRTKRNRNIGVWTLFSRGRLARNTMLLTTSWSINVLVYYGITLNTTNMEGSQFLNFFLLSIIEIPSGMSGGFLADRLGRRWTQVFFFFLCMICCIGAAIFIHFTALELAAVVLAKFAVTLTFLIVYLQGAEIFPTQLRSTGSGFASTMGAIAGIFAPIMAQLSTYHLSYPYWIMAVLCFVGLAVSSLIPETLSQNLPETIEDANKFGKDVKFWSLFPKARSKSIASTLSSLRTPRRSTVGGHGENTVEPPTTNSD